MQKKSPTDINTKCTQYNVQKWILMATNALQTWTSDDLENSKNKKQNKNKIGLL